MSKRLGSAKLRFRRSISAALRLFATMASPSFVQASDAISIGTASFGSHNLVFERMVADFVSGLSTSDQQRWLNINLGESTGATASSSSSGVAIQLARTQSLGYSKEFGHQLFGNGTYFSAEASLNSTSYYFPDGIRPFVDPITLDITSLDATFEILSKTTLARSNRNELSLLFGAGAIASFSSAHLTSALLDVHDQTAVVLPFTSVALQNSNEFGLVDFSLRLPTHRQVDFGISYKVVW